MEGPHKADQEEIKRRVYCVLPTAFVKWKRKLATEREQTVVFIFRICFSHKFGAQILQIQWKNVYRLLAT